VQLPLLPVQLDVHVPARVDDDQLREPLQVGDHAPAQPQPYGFEEIGRARYVVARRIQPPTGAALQVAVLQPVVAVEDDDRGLRVRVMSG
jgi:hypothetical protein